MDCRDLTQLAADSSPAGRLRAASHAINQSSKLRYNEIVSEFYDAWTVALAKYDREQNQVKEELQTMLEFGRAVLEYRESEGSDPDVVDEQLSAAQEYMCAAALEAATARAAASQTEFNRVTGALIAECSARSSAHLAAVQCALDLVERALSNLAQP